MPLVFDTSSIVSATFADEDPAYAQAVILQLVSDIAYVPPLFWYEITNVLLVGERRKRLTERQASLFLTSIKQLKIIVGTQRSESTLLLYARSHGLTIYDAAYLELAQRRGLSLATTDKALIRAAQAMSVPLWARP